MEKYARPNHRSNSQGTSHFSFTNVSSRSRKGTSRNLLDPSARPTRGNMSPMFNLHVVQFAFFFFPFDSAGQSKKVFETFVLAFNSSLARNSWQTQHSTQHPETLPHIAKVKCTSLYTLYPRNPSGSAALARTLIQAWGSSQTCFSLSHSWLHKWVTEHRFEMVQAAAHKTLETIGAQALEALTNGSMLFNEFNPTNWASSNSTRSDRGAIKQDALLCIYIWMCYVLHGSYIYYKYKLLQRFNKKEPYFTYWKRRRLHGAHMQRHVAESKIEVPPNLKNPCWFGGYI